MSVAHKFEEKARTNDVLITETVDFAGLLLSEPVLSGLQSAGFERPSPIQLKAIPLGRCGLDLIVQAKSGTGKTCVFTVIILETIQVQASSTQVLVLAPTREIAIQIWEVIKTLGGSIPDLQCHTFIGGLPLHEDKKKLQLCHIAVGTPGRIQSLIESGCLKTKNIRLFILDEADKLLESSFQEQINWIYSALPENKQMLALSATYPENLAQHLTVYMRNPTFIRLNISDPTLLGIKQYFISVPNHPLPNMVFESKTAVVVKLLSSVNFHQCLIFSNMQTRAQNLESELTIRGWPTTCIAGSLDQKERITAMAKLKSYKCRVLISTDLTSRGIDADKVNLVINLDVPKDHETYLHRIGRAGRFGSYGAAVTVVSEGQELLDLRTVERKISSHIRPLPDSIPSDLVKHQLAINLDDVVSTETIITRSHQESFGSVHSNTEQISPILSSSVDLCTNSKPSMVQKENIASITTEQKVYSGPSMVQKENIASITTEQKVYSGPSMVQKENSGPVEFDNASTLSDAFSNCNFSDLTSDQAKPSLDLAHLTPISEVGLARLETGSVQYFDSLVHTVATPQITTALNHIDRASFHCQFESDMFSDTLPFNLDKGELNAETDQGAATLNDTCAVLMTDTCAVLMTESQTSTGEIIPKEILRFDSEASADLCKTSQNGDTCMTHSKLPLNSLDKNSKESDTSKTASKENIDHVDMDVVGKSLLSSTADCMRKEVDIAVDKGNMITGCTQVIVGKLSDCGDQQIRRNNSRFMSKVNHNDGEVSIKVNNESLPETFQKSPQVDPGDQTGKVIKQKVHRLGSSTMISKFEMDNGILLPKETEMIFESNHKILPFIQRDELKQQNLNEIRFSAQRDELKHESDNSKFSPAKRDESDLENLKKPGTGAKAASVWTQILTDEELTSNHLQLMSESDFSFKLVDSEQHMTFSTKQKLESESYGSSSSLEICPKMSKEEVCVNDLSHVDKGNYSGRETDCDHKAESAHPVLDTKSGCSTKPPGKSSSHSKTKIADLWTNMLHGEGFEDDDVKPTHVKGDCPDTKAHRELAKQEKRSSNKKLHQTESEAIDDKTRELDSVGFKDGKMSFKNENRGSALSGTAEVRNESSHKKKRSGNLSWDAELALYIAARSKSKLEPDKEIPEQQDQFLDEGIKSRPVLHAQRRKGRKEKQALTGGCVSEQKETSCTVFEEQSQKSVIENVQIDSGKAQSMNIYSVLEHKSVGRDTPASMTENLDKNIPPSVEENAFSHNTDSKSNDFDPDACELISLKQQENLHDKRGGLLSLQEQTTPKTCAGIKSIPLDCDASHSFTISGKSKLANSEDSCLADKNIIVEFDETLNENNPGIAENMKIVPPADNFSFNFPLLWEVSMSKSHSSKEPMSYESVLQEYKNFLKMADEPGSLTVSDIVKETFVTARSTPSRECLNQMSSVLGDFYTKLKCAVLNGTVLKSETDTQSDSKCAQYAHSEAQTEQTIEDIKCVGRKSKMPQISDYIMPQVNGNIMPLVNDNIPQVSGNILPQANGNIMPQFNGNLMLHGNGSIMPQVNGNIMPQVNGNLMLHGNGSIMPQVNGNIMPQVNSNTSHKEKEIEKENISFASVQSCLHQNSNKVHLDERPHSEYIASCKSLQEENSFLLSDKDVVIALRPKIVHSKNSIKTATTLEKTCSSADKLAHNCDIIKDTDISLVLDSSHKSSLPQGYGHSMSKLGLTVEKKNKLQSKHDSHIGKFSAGKQKAFSVSPVNSSVFNSLENDRSLQSLKLHTVHDITGLSSTDMENRHHDIRSNDSLPPAILAANKSIYHHQENSHCISDLRSMTFTKVEQESSSQCYEPLCMAGEVASEESEDSSSDLSISSSTSEDPLDPAVKDKSTKDHLVFYKNYYFDEPENHLRKKKSDDQQRKERNERNVHNTGAHARRRKTSCQKDESAERQSRPSKQNSAGQQSGNCHRITTRSEKNVPDLTSSHSKLWESYHSFPSELYRYPPIAHNTAYPSQGHSNYSNEAFHSYNTFPPFFNQYWQPSIAADSWGYPWQQHQRSCYQRNYIHNTRASPESWVTCEKKWPPYYFNPCGCGERDPRGTQSNPSFWDNSRFDSMKLYLRRMSEFYAKLSKPDC